MLTEKMQILERWAEHFNIVPNRPSSINNAAISRLPQLEINQELDDVPSVAEVDKAMMQMSSRKPQVLMPYLLKFTKLEAPSCFKD